MERRCLAPVALKIKLEYFTQKQDRREKLHGTES